MLLAASPCFAFAVVGVRVPGQGVKGPSLLRVQVPGAGVRATK